MDALALWATNKMEALARIAPSSQSIYGLVLPDGVALDAQGLGVGSFLFVIVVRRKDRLILI